MSRHHGFTWVEVLVFVAIVGTLIGLLLPATQSSREASSRIHELSSEKAAESLDLQLLKREAKIQSLQRTLSSGGDSLRFKGKGDSARKISYKASINLVVKDFSQAESRLRELVEKHGGFLADARIDRRQGSRLSGNWQARIPVDQFPEFCEAITDLGVAEQQQQTAQDVTEEFVDLEARIANKQRLEERIVDLLEDASGSIKTIIEVERELARVRQEIERMEGRLRYLTNHTELTTVTISIREKQDYVPPKAPTYSDRVSTAWYDSLTSVQEFGQRSLISLVYAFPWLAIAGVLLVPSAWLFRRVRERTSEKSDDPLAGE